MRRTAAAITLATMIIACACTKADRPPKVGTATPPSATSAAGTTSKGAPIAKADQKTDPDFGDRVANTINRAKQEAAEENKRVDEINKQINQ